MVAPIVVGSLIAGGAGLIGGAMNSISGSNANDRNLSMAQQNIDLQKEFARNGIRWRVADAKAAGIHPLAALGANTTSFSPVTAFQQGSNAGDSVALAGQNVGKMVSALPTTTDKVLTAIEIDKQKATLENMKLQNVGLREQIDANRKNQVISSQGVLPGQADSEVGVTRKNSELPYAQAPGLIAGQGDLEQAVRLPGDTVMYIPHQDYSDSMESDVGSQYSVMLNRAQRYIQGIGSRINPDTYEAQKFREDLIRERPKHYRAKEGYEYRFSVADGMWHGVYRGKQASSLFYEDRVDRLLGFTNKMLHGGKGNDQNDRGGFVGTGEF